MINSIQYLRAYAALLVVILHSSIQYTNKIDSSFLEYVNFYNIGSIGVDIFFVISGFIIHYINKPIFTAFIVGRLIRVLPIYWLLTILYIVLSYVNPSTLYEFDFYHFVFSILLIPYPAVSGAYAPVLWVAWTLTYEMFFYIAYGMLILKFKSSIKIFIMLLSIYPIINFNNDYIQTKDILMSPLIFEFLFGIVIAEIYKSKLLNNTNNYVYIFIICIGLGSSVYFNYTDYYRFLYYGIPSAFLVLIVLELNRSYQFNNKLILLIGESSYSLYLTHIFTLSLLVKIWTTFKLPSNVLFFYSASIIFTTITAIIFHLFIEKTIQKSLKWTR